VLKWVECVAVGWECVAVCRSVLQCAAVSCSVLPCVAVCCSVLQSVAACCRELRCVAVGNVDGQDDLEDC